MKNKIYLLIIGGYVFSVHSMEIKSLFFSVQEASSENKAYSDDLIERAFKCESHTYRDLQCEDFVLKDGGEPVSICESAIPQISSSEGGSFCGDFHIQGNYIEKSVLGMARKKSYDKKYKPPQTFQDNRRWWNRYGNYTAGLLGCLIVYNIWHIKLSK